MKQTMSCIFVASALLASGCGDSITPPTVVQQPSSTQPDASSAALAIPAEAPVGNADGTVFGDQFPKVLAVNVTFVKNASWRFNVTLSSPYDTPERYADAWRVLDDQDNELGIRILAHDHASEQPFTRSQTIELPDQKSPVFVEGRDQVNGWSGQRFEVNLPDPESVK